MSETNKVYIVHRHEACEGSTIIGVFKSALDAKICRRKAMRSFTAHCDEADIEVCEIE